MIIATFNCENLFSRPKIFTEPSDKSLKLLDKVHQLQEELKQEIFDQEKIAQLKKELSGFATINNIRGSVEKAQGKNDWIGNIELVRMPVTENALVNTSRVIKDIDADIFCLIEVENRPTLQTFHDEYIVKQLKAKGYKNVLCIDGNDDRGIDVAILTRLDIINLRTHISEESNYLGKKVKTFDRDCLEVDLKVGTKQVTLMINHFKSMGYNGPEDFLGNKKRSLQAQRVNELANSHKLDEEYVIVAGDLNSPPESESLKNLLSNKNLHNIIQEEIPLEENRGTYRTGKQQLDYIIASNALKKKFKRVEIYRMGLYSKKYPHYENILSRKDEASDHAAVVVEFDL